jgi:aromatic-L-amino-acid decarboxylase
MPSKQATLEEALDELQHVIEPGLVRWDAAGWFAFFPSNAHPHALLGDLLSACLGQQGMLWMTSPACTEVEIRVMEWLRLALGLPACFAEGGKGGGVIQDTASSAVLACMVAARDRVTQGVARTHGLQHVDGAVTVYTSTEGHSSVLKAASLCGIGQARCRLVPVDAHRQMDVEALRSMVASDVEAGCRPAFCCATVGTTACGAIDPVEAIASVCDDHGLWLHVDAAWAGTAALSKERRTPIVAGAHRASSWCFNPHKWMGVPFDCSCLWLADREALVSAMSITPEYLRNAPSDTGQVIDFRDWHVQLGRRFRALKVWLLLRCTGVEALAAMIEHHISLAVALEQRIETADHLLLAAERSLTLLCVRHEDGDDATQAMLDTVNADGRFATTHCRLDDRLVMRIAIGTLDVEAEHIDALFQCMNSGPRAD